MHGKEFLVTHIAHFTTGKQADESRGSTLVLSSFFFKVLSRVSSMSKTFDSMFTKTWKAMFMLMLGFEDGYVGLISRIS
jgi:hypothetical protein